MPHSKLRPNYLFDEEKINELKRIAPEAFADGKINWDVLKENLGEYLEDLDEVSESFGLNWPGKKQARKIASIPSKGTLVPVEGEGVNESNTKNIFIEGENLEVLKILQKSYAGRVKMIYIDPPYNTGKDFIYEDNFRESIQEYLRRTGQINEEEKPLTTNTRADGRFHSKWLSMMYPRLRLARNLLRDDGVIFVSIDDNEIHNLRQIMNEIFGEENIIGTIKRRAARKTAHLSETMSDMCDYIVIYTKSGIDSPLSIEKVSDTTRPVFNEGNNIVERIIPKGSESRYKDGVCKAGIYKVKSLSFELLNDLIIKNNKTENEVIVKAPWRVNQDVINKSIYITKNFGFRRYVLQEELEKVKALNDLIDDKEYYNEKGSEELEKIFGIKNIFDNPKPHTLIKYLLKSCDTNQQKEAFIVLDFFAGSATTGHSVFEYNVDEINETNKRFILVQMQEIINKDSVAYKNGYRFINQLSKRRLKNVIANSMDNNGNINHGFKVLKLVESNFIEWHDNSENDLGEITSFFEKTTNPLIEGWKEEQVLSEIILIEGFPLDSTIEEDKSYKNNKIILVGSEYHEHKLIVCLDKTIREETIKNLKINDNDIFICLDSAITDNDKVVLADKGIIKTI